jgi:ATP-dependent Clp protease protease subunit
MAFHTGKDKTLVAKDTDRDFFMSADEAKNYGLVDNVVNPHQKKS